MNVLVEAKTEYTKQLISILTPQLYIGIQSIYTAASDYCDKSGDKNIWSKFQYLLARTPSWNQEKLDNEFKRIIKITECDYIEDLLTAVFVSHTKIYSSIRLKKLPVPAQGSSSISNESISNNSFALFHRYEA